MPKLTLSVDESVIREARRLARREGTSISSLFSRLVRAMGERGRRRDEELPPRTRRALGIISLPKGKSDRERMEEAVLEKHGLDG